jgi:hypothetical protein
MRIVRIPETIHQRIAHQLIVVKKHLPTALICGGDEKRRLGEHVAVLNMCATGRGL